MPAEPPEIENVYADADYAGQYSALDWTGSYYLIRRDLPEILERHATGRKALDFGCGAGRSTRLLKELGFDATGVDVSAAMVELARKSSPDQKFVVIEDGDFSAFEPGSFDLVFACFPFDNIPGDERKVALFKGLAGLLAPGGIFVNIVSAPEIYTNEWASFTTSQFEENRGARPGDVVRIITTDFEGSPVCDDIFTDEATYRELYARAGLEPIAAYQPLGHSDDPVAWKSESQISPWMIWVLAP